MAAAYGDSTIIADLFESVDSDIKSIGGALLDASGTWAQMREEAKACGLVHGWAQPRRDAAGMVSLLTCARAEP